MRFLFPLFSVFVLLSVGCAKKPCPLVADDAAPVAAADIDSVLFLTGDAGEPESQDDRVLASLRRAVNEAVASQGADRVRVVFLGDNLYPDGLPDTDHPRYERYRAKLDPQIAVFRDQPAGSEPMGIFVPGNHDWKHDAKDGTQRILNQQKYLADKSEGRVALWPGEGCPGPRKLDVGNRLRLIAVDTHWWIRKADKPGSECDAATQEEVKARIAEMLADAGDRRVVLAGHHPFQSGGPHGTNRALGLIPQDVTHKRYRNLIDGFTEAFADHPPLIYAAGHDHNLQVIRGKGYGFQVISGAGNFDHETGVGALDETLFCQKTGGFIRIDIDKKGGVRLSAHAVGKTETGTVYSTWLINP
ncbi:MAG: metallophosphoesterase [Acidobacteriota bacterium]|nr:metallophosphoesterase [Acidobacteriota bacterium]